jgi:hypothetical protein
VSAAAPLYAALDGRFSSAHVFAGMDAVRPVCGRRPRRNPMARRRFALAMDRRCKTCVRIAKGRRARIHWDVKL